MFERLDLVFLLSSLTVFFAYLAIFLPRTLALFAEDFTGQFCLLSWVNLCIFWLLFELLNPKGSCKSIENRLIFTFNTHSTQVHIINLGIAHGTHTMCEKIFNHILPSVHIQYKLSDTTFNLLLSFKDSCRFFLRAVLVPCCSMHSLFQGCQRYKITNFRVLVVVQVQPFLILSQTIPDEMD